MRTVVTIMYIWKCFFDNGMDTIFLTVHQGHPIVTLTHTEREFKIVRNSFSNYFPNTRLRKHTHRNRTYTFERERCWK